MSSRDKDTGSAAPCQFAVCYKVLSTGTLRVYEGKATAEEARDWIGSKTRRQTFFDFHTNYRAVVARLVDGQWIEIEDVEGPLTAEEIAAATAEDEAYRRSHASA